jgi:hypothetical protein
MKTPVISMSVSSLNDRRRPSVCGIRSLPARGMATVPVVLMLLLGLGIMGLYANRGLVFEQRTAANQARSTQAFEVAEAGLEWAGSMLNSNTLVGNDCLENASAAQTFRDRFLTFDSTTGLIALRADSANPGNYLRAACVFTGSGLRCSCPGSGFPTFGASDIGENFLVTFEAPSPARPGVLRVTVNGCTSTGVAAKDPSCLPGGTGRADARARVTSLYALLPLLGTAPAAPVTLAGNVTWQGSGAAVGIFNTDAASQGITIRAGGDVDASKARVTSMPGTPAARSIVANDGTLSALGADALFTSFFGMSKQSWRQLSTVITCGTNCVDTLQASVASGAQGIWVEGDLEIQGNASIGSADRPVVIVVNGRMLMRGTATIFGMVYASEWDNTGGGSALLRGAVMSESSFTANGSADFYFDPLVLGRLTSGGAGTFARLPGSWRDY